MHQLETTLTDLRTANASLAQRATDAERDRALFLDLYNKASSHASSLSSANASLTSQLSVARSQLSDGLAMIKRTFQSRIEVLETENKRLRKTADILARRDALSGEGEKGDEVRKRANEAQELKAENMRLREELERLRVDYERLEGVLEQFGEGELEGLGEVEEELRERAGVEVGGSTLGHGARPTLVQTRTPTGPIVTVEEVS